MRDRLIAMLSKPIYPKVGVDPAEVVADYLLDNGVIVLPCKVGDKLWYQTYKNNGKICVGIQPHTVDRVDITLVCNANSLVETNIPDWCIGKIAFLTKGEAEQALKGE